MMEDNNLKAKNKEISTDSTILQLETLRKGLTN